MHFEVAVGEYLPFLRLTVLFGRVYMSGPLAEAFHTLSVRLNFTYTLHKVKGNSWGILGPNGWTGMLGMISRNEVDMAVGPFTMTYDRSSSFKLSHPLYADNVEILVPAPEWKMTLFSVVTVFSLSVWISVFVSLISVSVMIAIIDKYKIKNSDNFSRRFLRNLWTSTSILLQKGKLKKSDFYLQTFLGVIWMFSTLILALVFGCVMLTRLFVRKVQKIDSIIDLIAAPHLQPILEADSSLYSIFQNSQSEVYSTLFQRVTSHPDVGVQSFENMSTIGMDLVSSGSAAMLTDGMGLKGFMAERLNRGLPCNFWLAKEAVLTMWKVIAFSKDFPDTWIMKINSHLRSTIESGWLRSRMSSAYGVYDQCITQANSEFDSLGLEHIKGVFLIWSFGCAVAISVFLIEFYKGKRRKVIPANL